MGVTTEFGELVWGPTRSPVGMGRGAYDLDDADDYVAGLFVVPRSGTITHIGWRLESKSGTPPNYYAGIVTVTASTGSPTVTAYGGSTPATLDPTVLSTGFQWTALAANATAIAGDCIAVRIWPTGAPGNPDGSNYIRCSYGHVKSSSNAPQGGYSAVVFTTSQLVPAFGLKYSDSVVIGFPPYEAAYTAYDSADSPDEVGVKFTVPYAMNAIGVRVNMVILDSNVGYTVYLYDAANNVLASYAVTDEDLFDGAGIMNLYWSTAVPLSAGSVYRLAITSSSASSTILPGSALWPDAASKTAYHQGAAFIGTSRTDGGAWTDNSNATVFISPIVDQITLPDGGGGPRWL